VYSIVVDVRDATEAQLAKLGITDAQTLLLVTQTALTGLLTNFGTLIDPPLPQCLQTAYASAVPMVVTEIIYIETSVVNAAENAGLEGMRAQVTDYVRGCEACARAKSSSQPPAGLLQPLPIPGRPWEVITLDFVGPLKSEGDEGRQLDGARGGRQVQ
jgi:hypothetical protein